MEVEEYTYQEDNTGLDSAPFADVVWSEFKHNILLNQIAFNDKFSLCYPTRKLFKDLMHKNSQNIGMNRDNEVTKFDEATQGLIKGVNYVKLKEPKQVFNHLAPRSLLSILHILVNNAGSLER